MNEDLGSIRERFDARSADYDFDPFHRALAAAVAAFADTDGVASALDVATGTGLVLRALAPRLAASARLVGVDVSPGMLSVARRERPGAEWIEADAAALPLPDASFDLVTCVTALHIIPRADAAIAEWARVLAPGGRAVVATFARAPEQGHGAYRSDHARWLTAELLGAAVAPAGFLVGRSDGWTWDPGTERELPMLLAELVRPPRT